MLVPVDEVGGAAEGVEKALHLAGNLSHQRVVVEAAHGRMSQPLQ